MSRACRVQLVEVRFQYLTCCECVAVLDLFWCFPAARHLGDRMGKTRAGADFRRHVFSMMGSGATVVGPCEGNMIW